MLNNRTPLKQIPSAAQAGSLTSPPSGLAFQGSEFLEHDDGSNGDSKILVYTKSNGGFTTRIILRCFAKLLCKPHSSFTVTIYQCALSNHSSPSIINFKKGFRPLKSSNLWKVIKRTSYKKFYGRWNKDVKLCILAVCCNLWNWMSRKWDTKA